MSKNDVQNPDIYDFEFLFSKNVISRYYRNYQHFFSNWHYVWRKMNFFLYFFIHFHHGWQVEISLFSIIFTILQSDTPLSHSVAEKTSKSVKNVHMGFSTKTRKSVITRRKWFFQNFRKKCTYGDFDENFSKFARCLGVKTRSETCIFDSQWQIIDLRHIHENFFIFLKRECFSKFPANCVNYLSLVLWSKYFQYQKMIIIIF